MIIITSIASIIAIGLGIFISKFITKPLSSILNMINEMSKGKLGRRLNFETKYEVGQMANALDELADILQHEVIDSIKKISEGNTNIHTENKSQKDEITPHINFLIKTFSTLVKETNNLSKATIAGNLNVRADASKQKGEYKKHCRKCKPYYR